MGKKYIGIHVPVIGGVENTPFLATRLGAESFALFTKNQKQWKGKPLTPEAAARFRENLKASGIQPHLVLPHNGYLINIGNPDPEKRRRSIDSLKEEAERVRELGLLSLNFHPGSHLGRLGNEECLDLVAQGMNEILGAVNGISLILETTAGQGTSIGWKFEQIARLIEKSAAPDRVGVCIDTCHIFAAGYELRTESGYKKTMADFEKTIGFSKLRGVHLNDAKSEFNSRVDRHASIGKGNLGIEAFRLLLSDPRFDNIPLVLETPSHRLWEEELILLKSIAGGTAQ